MRQKPIDRLVGAVEHLNRIVDDLGEDHYGSTSFHRGNLLERRLEMVIADLQFVLKNVGDLIE